MRKAQFSIDSGELILAINPGHDGAVAALGDGALLFSFEAEHDSHPRHLPANAYLLIKAIQRLERFPAAIATSGWDNVFPFQSARTPYEGVDEKLVRTSGVRVLGKDTVLFESTHERSHIFCAYGMSPFPQGEPCYALVWEGSIGSFYEIDENMHIVQLGPVLRFPGYKYSFLFDLADPSCRIATWRHETAGKLMALAAFSKRTTPSVVEQTVIGRILRDVNPPATDKNLFQDTAYLNCGVTNPAFQDLVRAFSDSLFNTFHAYAERHLRKGYPLLIAGGCGLNCEWNSMWRDSGLFRDVFVPPVANDSGSAIGTAIEARCVLSGEAKISWNVYSGEEFVWDAPADGFIEAPLDYSSIVDLLCNGKVVAWVQGRSEIGPRALGNRSLLASPFEEATKDRLNAVKQREWYRPIAPVCIEEDAEAIFGLNRSSPFMLYFHATARDDLRAITHVDGSARVQTVSRSQNPGLYTLLSFFKARNGVGVLCNTSLNRKGRGFINRSSDLFSFAREKGIDAVVVHSRCYLLNNVERSSTPVAPQTGLASSDGDAAARVAHFAVDGR